MDEDAARLDAVGDELAALAEEHEQVLVSVVVHTHNFIYKFLCIHGEGGEGEGRVRERERGEKGERGEEIPQHAEDQSQQQSRFV